MQTAAPDHPRCVSVGDGLWDVKTARELRLPFVGIADEDRAQELRRAGATHVFADFSDFDAIVEALNCAGIPMHAIA